METNTIKKITLKKNFRSKTNKNYKRKIKYKLVNLNPEKNVNIEERKIREVNLRDNLILKLNKYKKENNIMGTKNNKAPKEQESKTKEFTFLKKPVTQIKEEFYFLDNNEQLKNIIKTNDNNEGDFFLISKNNWDDWIKSLYKKEDFIKDYQFIYISYENKCFKLLFPRYKYDYKQNKEEIIMNELKNSKLDKKLEKLFNP